MAIVDFETMDGVAVITMNNGQNLQNLDFAQAMMAALNKAVENTDVFSVVITSSDEKFFSNGVDIEWVGAKMASGELDGIKSFMYTMNDVFKTILEMPVPVIASINGHAFGNGAIL